MNSSIFQVQVVFADPFTTELPGSGNPAAVVLLGPAASMKNSSQQSPIQYSANQQQLGISDCQKAYIAAYLKQPETIFASQTAPGEWLVDWYTPDGVRIAPGGNSTIALAKVLLSRIEPELKQVQLRSIYPGFDSTAYLEDDGRISVTIPAVSACQIIPASRTSLIQTFGEGPVEFLAGQQDLIVVFENEAQVRAIKPKFWCLNSPYQAFIATAKGDETIEGAVGRFVYRTFVANEQQSGWECPGSARALMNLVPYWCSHLSLLSQDILAEQLSDRGGVASCRLVCPDDRGCQVLVTTDCPIRMSTSIEFPNLAL